MGSAIQDIIVQGRTVEVDLLLAIPRTTDRRSWALPSWRGYMPAFATPYVDLNGLPGGFAFSILAQFLASEGVWPVEAAAVSYQGSTLFVAPFRANGICTSITPFPVRIEGIFNGVQS